MPVKKKVKKIKLKAMRGARAERAPTKKPNVKQVVNVYTTRAEPYRTDFRDQYRYGLGYVEREQTPFQPVFNYIQPPAQSVAKVEEKKVEVKEPKEKRTYKKKPIVVGVPFTEQNVSRQSSGYETDFFMPNETELFRQPTRAEESEVLARKKIREMEQELRNQPSDPEFFTGNVSPTITEPKRRGRPVGSKSKPKAETPFTLPKPVGQTDIMSFFGKTGGSKTNE
jgi:hypothetical protein